MRHSARRWRPTCRPTRQRAGQHRPKRVPSRRRRHHFDQTQWQYPGEVVECRGRRGSRRSCSLSSLVRPFPRSTFEPTSADLIADIVSSDPYFPIQRQATLAALARSSRFFNTLATPLLYAKPSLVTMRAARRFGRTYRASMCPWERAKGMTPRSDIPPKRVRRGSRARGGARKEGADAVRPSSR